MKQSKVKVEVLEACDDKIYSKGVSAEFLEHWLSRSEPSMTVLEIESRIAGAKKLGTFHIDVPEKDMGKPEIRLTPNPSATVKDLINALKDSAKKDSPGNPSRLKKVYCDLFCIHVKTRSESSFHEGRRMTNDEKQCVLAMAGVNKSFF